MSSFSTVLNNKGQFIIVVKVIKSPEPKAYKERKAQELFAKKESKRALIDTGASNTCISQECAEELGLIPIAMENLTTASDVCQVNVYKVDIAIPVAITTLQPVKKKDGKTSIEQVVIREDNWAHLQHKVHSVPSIGKDRGFDVILGMDILSQMHITILNNRIIMSF